MYHFLSVLAGILVAISVEQNGDLAASFGLNSSTVIIHVVGLLFVCIILAVKREKFLPVKKMPFHLYLGGAVGVVTVVFCNLSYGRISVSAILALGLLGQSITALVFDRYGFWNMPRHAFSKAKLFGIAFVLLGIVLMLINSSMDALVPVILSLLTGVSTVVSRTINAALAKETSVLKSTVFNYITGLSVSAVVLLIAGRNEPMIQNFSLSPNVWIYLGGVVGVCAVSMLNAAVCKISSFYMTLLLFAGQVFTGIVIDILLTGSFMINNLVGGIAITIGLAQNLWIDKRGAGNTSPCGEA
jgi:transporter family-2 protein